MNLTAQQIWQEVLADILTQTGFWQIAIIFVACTIAWAINGMLRAYVKKRVLGISSENVAYSAAAEGLSRILFPMVALTIIWLSKILLVKMQHISLLQLANQLLLAMVAIRFLVYIFRYVFTTSSWLKRAENAIASVIWIVLALHLTGLLPELLNALDDISFTVGKNKVTLLLVMQAILTVVITVITALWLSRIIENRLMQSNNLNPNMRVVLSKVLRIALIVFAVLFAFSAIGLDITLLSVFSGALGIGLGFGLQRIASNFISGFILLLDDSMQMGDVITVDKHHGIVNDLRSRYMILAKSDGTHVIIPNETLITNAVVNHSLVEHKGRVQINLTISHNSKLEHAMTLMHELAMQQERVLMKPAPEVIVKGITEHGVDLALGVWIMNPESGNAALQTSLYVAILHAFQANGIAFAKMEASRSEG